MRHNIEIISMMLLLNGAFLCLTPRLTEHLAFNFLSTTIKHGAGILDGFRHFIGFMMIFLSIYLWFFNLCCRCAALGAAGVILSILIGMEVSSYFIVVASSVSLKANVRSTLTLFLQEYKAAPDFREAWDKVQNTLTCCGVESYRDWDKWNITVPLSCCAKEELEEEEEEDSCSPGSLHQRGCLLSIMRVLVKGGLLNIAMSFLTLLNLITLLSVLEDAESARRSWFVSQC